jgi:hypothetical protein
VPKKHFDFRLSDQAVETLEAYRLEYSLDNLTAALERIVLRFKYLDKARTEKLSENEELLCVSRIKYDGVFWCVFKPPKMKELETLDICVVCKKRSLGLTEKSIMRSGAETESSPRLNMVLHHSTKAPFSYAPDRTRSSDPLERPSVPRPQGFHCALGKNQTYCYNNLCDQRGTCETQVER